MKIIPFVLLLFLVFAPNAYSQDISGSWRWYEEEDKSLEIYLVKADSTFQERFDFVGTHCGVYQNGNRMDCAVEDYSIFIKQQSENSYSGKIKSAYSLTEFEIRLTYLESEKKILWEVTKKGEGQYYFPMKAFLE
ncbi:MAG: hypothetical protein Q8S14_10605 [Algoriphagus sp.]|uniref:hypothetical protein n=1 Tax=Algoriphagus sp. TaxID=1872435 RepID=UPI0027306152|nr:hypothetical protein [Algoriphagus sp.]MDP2041077.1 hypothetical protein [Algoriphagus sp.]MDP3472311.1 hypothetical protein [Algoriphagus sp.]